MKLYYAPGTCALAPHIVAREAGIDLTLEKVDLKAKTTSTHRNYLEINPKGYVPALELDSGEVLTEGPVVSQYLADRKPDTGLAPAEGTIERYRLLSMLAYIGTELHKNYSPLFNPATVAETRKERIDSLRKRYAFIEQQLSGKKPFLLGDTFTIADAYLYAVTRWADKMNVDLTDMPHLRAFQKRVGERPAVKRALQEEGLEPG